MSQIIKEESMESRELHGLEENENLRITLTKGKIEDFFFLAVRLSPDSEKQTSLPYFTRINSNSYRRRHHSCPSFLHLLLARSLNLTWI